MLAQNDYFFEDGSDLLTKGGPLTSSVKAIPEQDTVVVPVHRNLSAPTGAALRQARRQRGLSQTDLAELVGVSQSRISAWENNYDEVPYKFRRRLIDVLSNKGGVLDRLIRNLVANDPCVTVYERVTTDGLRDLKYLHIGGHPRFLFRDPDSEVGQRLSHHFEPVLLRQPNSILVEHEKLMVDFERDIVTSAHLGGQAVMRLRSQFIHLQFDDRPNLILSRCVAFGKPTGDPALVHEHLYVDELDQPS